MSTGNSVNCTEQLNASMFWIIPWLWQLTLKECMSAWFWQPCGLISWLRQLKFLHMYSGSCSNWAIGKLNTCRFVQFNRKSPTDLEPVCFHLQWTYLHRCNDLLGSPGRFRLNINLISYNMALCCTYIHIHGLSDAKSMCHGKYFLTINYKLELVRAVVRCWPWKKHYTFNTFPSPPVPIPFNLIRPWRGISLINIKSIKCNVFCISIDS